MNGALEQLDESTKFIERRHLNFEPSDNLLTRSLSNAEV
jgi:hypothetical protein